MSTQANKTDRPIGAGDAEKQRRTTTIVMGYPVALLLIGIVFNVFVFGVNPASVALPSIDTVRALVIAAVLLAINHTWIMTSTELTRVRFKMHATPEEWAESGTRQLDASEEGMSELERRHNLHRNTTENTVYFVLLVVILALISPTTGAAQTWILAFPVARVGYTYSYLAGRTDARGLFMSVSLLAVYGSASYLAMSLLI